MPITKGKLTIREYERPSSNEVNVCDLCEQEKEVKLQGSKLLCTTCTNSFREIAQAMRIPVCYKCGNKGFEGMDLVRRIHSLMTVTKIYRCKRCFNQFPFSVKAVGNTFEVEQHGQ